MWVYESVQAFFKSAVVYLEKRTYHVFNLTWLSIDSKASIWGNINELTWAIREMHVIRAFEIKALIIDWWTK